MIDFESAEYKALEVCLDEWNKVIARPIAPRDDSSVQLAELLNRRDNAYRAYRKAHGDPTPDEIRVLESRQAQAILLAGSPWLWISMNKLVDSYNLGGASLEYMSMTIVFFHDDVDFGSEGARRISLDFPHWNLELAEDREDY